MPVDLEQSLGEVLGPPALTDSHHLDEIFGSIRWEAAQSVRTALGSAGWHSRSAPPYPAPSRPISAPQMAKPPVVRAIRRLWIARFNPASPGWEHSDPDDDRYFPWQQPEDALLHGNYWLSTLATPANAPGIREVEVGDLVIVQRSDPKSAGRADLRGKHSDDVLIGAAIVASFDDWKERDTGERQRRICLLPAAKFLYPVPRSVARRHGRIKGGCFQRMPQHADGTGQPGFTLSAVTMDEWSELLAVCGIHPDAMAEPDLALLAARLRATALGNRAYWQYRWDHVFRHAIRRRHEQAAIWRCQRWAEGRGLVFREDAQWKPNAGFDLLFIDGRGREVQVEVKGYKTGQLDHVRLQASQVDRATASARGVPPDWWLFAVLRVHTKVPDEQLRHATEIVKLLSAGGIGRRRAAP